MVLMIFLAWSRFIIFILIILIILSIIIFLLEKPINIFISKQKLYKKLKTLFKDNDVEKLYKTKGLPYKYELVLRKNRYYIYLLKNNKNEDIHIIDNKFYFIDKNLKNKKEINIKSFLQFSPEIDNNRVQKKLVIVYPNTNFIYIHEGDVLKYMHPDSEVRGIYMISLTEFLNIEEL